jgi:hypothetical protein
MYHPPRIVAVSLATIALAFGLHTGVCIADSSTSGSDTFHVSGFGTLGVSQIDEPAGWAYTRSLGDAVNTGHFRADLDSRFGLQVNYRPTSQLELVGQAVASRLVPGATVGDGLELAFAAYRPDANWTLRGGRVNLDLYLLSDYRDVGFTYEFIRPPVEFYWQTPTSLDGGDLSRLWTFGDVQWKTKIYGGRTTEGLGVDRLIIGQLFGAMVSRESNGLLLRASGMHGRFGNTLNFQQELVDVLHGLDALPLPTIVAQANSLALDLQPSGAALEFLAAGLQYDRHNWMLSGEISHFAVDRLPEGNYTGGYGSIGRRFGDVSIFGVESFAAATASPISAPNWAQALAPFGPAVAQQAQYLASESAVAINTLAGRQHTTSLGARWDLSSQVALKTQWDHTQTSAIGALHWWGATTPAAGTVNVVSVAVDFVF